ncbi:AAA family ATPase [Cryobacterium sp. N21]|uniref:AAA family ATPase n=1 Tax=Cryobacterium sp. N21 TaxID=2048289 RepID=UPI001E2DB9CF|nr:AAA family ATPase [Cryobacterium sp. N21]
MELLIIDEAERLTPTALELFRDRQDRTHLAMILTGKPDQRFRDYPPAVQPIRILTPLPSPRARRTTLHPRAALEKAGPTAANF